jgi:hypothetical protein
MKLNNKQMQLLKTLCLLIVLMTIQSLSAYAQGPPSPGGENDPPGVPIDGGLSLLLAAGVGYGIKELRKKKGNIPENK